MPYDMTPEPMATDAEMALLSAILWRPRVMDDVVDIVTPDMFTDARHVAIWRVASEMSAAGQQPSVPAIAARLDTDPTLAAMGVKAHIAALAAAMVTVVNVTDYAKLVADAHKRRGTMEVCRQAIAEAQDMSTPDTASDVLERLETKLSHLAETGSTERPIVSMRDAAVRAMEAAEAAMKADGQLLGLPTGVEELDRVLGGLHSPDLVVVGARPGMGKSALLGTIARAAAARGTGVLIYSLEMGADQLAAREIAAHTGLSADRQRKGRLAPSDFTVMLEAQQAIAALPIWIDDNPGTSIARIRGRARRLKRRHGLGLIIIDYLQLLLGGKHEYRVQEMSKITRDLKAMALELQMPVVALSQLNRDVERREDKRPMLADLRESGSIEQDADVILFLYRHEYYLGKAKPLRKAGERDEQFNPRLLDWEEDMHRHKGKAEIIVAKNRHGPECTVDAAFDAERTAFGGAEVAA